MQVALLLFSPAKSPYFSTMLVPNVFCALPEALKKARLTNPSATRSSRPSSPKTCGGMIQICICNSTYVHTCITQSKMLARDGREARMAHKIMDMSAAGQGGADAYAGPCNAMSDGHACVVVCCTPAACTVASWVSGDHRCFILQTSMRGSPTQRQGQEVEEALGDVIVSVGVHRHLQACQNAVLKHHI